MVRNPFDNVANAAFHEIRIGNKIREKTKAGSTVSSAPPAPSARSPKFALRFAGELGPGHLDDDGTRYQRKMLNPAFLRSRELPARN